jgi:hypothetical protein
MLNVPHTSFVTLAVRGVSYWNITHLRLNRDIKCDLELVTSASILAKTFGDHNTSRL